MLIVAGGTGWATAKALLEELAHRRPLGRTVHLFVGARGAAGFYDGTALARLEARSPWLRVTRVTEADGPDALPAAVVRAADWSDHTAYLSGPAGLVATTAALLRQSGVPDDRVRHDPFPVGPGPVATVGRPAALGRRVAPRRPPPGADAPARAALTHPRAPRAPARAVPAPADLAPGRPVPARPSCPCRRRGRPRPGRRRRDSPPKPSSGTRKISGFFTIAFTIPPQPNAHTHRRHKQLTYRRLPSRSKGLKCHRRMS